MTTGLALAIERILEELERESEARGSEIIGAIVLSKKGRRLWRQGTGLEELPPQIQCLRPVTCPGLKGDLLLRKHGARA
jgi:hypothetical protein